MTKQRPSQPTPSETINSLPVPGSHAEFETNGQFPRPYRELLKRQERIGIRRKKKGLGGEALEGVAESVHRLFRGNTLQARKEAFDRDTFMEAPDAYDISAIAQHHETIVDTSDALVVVLDELSARRATNPYTASAIETVKAMTEQLPDWLDRDVLPVSQQVEESLIGIANNYEHVSGADDSNSAPKNLLGLVKFAHETRESARRGKHAQSGPDLEATTTSKTISRLYEFLQLKYPRLGPEEPRDPDEAVSESSDQDTLPPPPGPQRLETNDAARIAQTILEAEPRHAEPSVISALESIEHFSLETMKDASELQSSVLPTTNIHYVERAIRELESVASPDTKARDTLKQLYELLNTTDMHAASVSENPLQRGSRTIHRLFDLRNGRFQNQQAIPEHLELGGITTTAHKRISGATDSWDGGHDIQERWSGPTESDVQARDTEIRTVQSKNERLGATQNQAATLLDLIGLATRAGETIRQQLGTRPETYLNELMSLTGTTEQDIAEWQPRLPTQASQPLNPIERRERWAAETLQQYTEDRIVSLLTAQLRQKFGIDQ